MESRRHTPSPYKNLDKKLTKFVFTREENISLPDVKKTNKSYSLLKDEGQASSIANLQKKIEFFLTEVEDRLDNIRKSPSPEVSLYKPSLDVSDISNKSYQFISETTHKHFSTTPTNRKSDFSPSPLKLLGKVRAKSIEKQEIQNKKSIVALMKSSNAFEKDQQIDKEIFNKLQKDLGNSKKPLIESLYTEIHNKETVYDAYKQYARGKSEYDKESPTSVYSKKCNDEHVPPIPIFTYIQDQSLILNRYNLNDNLCNVINESLYTLKNLRQIHLDECGITDQGGAYLLKGIATQGNIISFYYTRNEIGSKFADEFKKNSINFQFQEINLNRCRYTGSSLVETLRAINMCKHITKLFLSELGLSALAIDQICRCLRKTTLIELDLS